VLKYSCIISISRFSRWGILFCRTLYILYGVYRPWHFIVRSVVLPNFTAPQRLVKFCAIKDGLLRQAGSQHASRTLFIDHRKNTRTTRGRLASVATGLDNGPPRRLHMLHTTNANVITSAPISLPFNPLISILKPQSNGPLYSNTVTGRWWVGCYIWYSEEGPGRAGAPPSPLLAVPNVTAHPSTASVPTSYYSMWHYNCLWILKG